MGLESRRGQGREDLVGRRHRLRHIGVRMHRGHRRRDQRGKKDLLIDHRRGREEIGAKSETDGRPVSVLDICEQ